MVYATPSHVAAAPRAEFPEGVDLHWETESHLMWNEQERTAEEQELIYEVSWIPELGDLAPLSQVAEEDAEMRLVAADRGRNGTLRFVRRLSAGYLVLNTPEQGEWSRRLLEIPHSSLLKAKCHPRSLITATPTLCYSLPTGTPSDHEN